MSITTTRKYASHLDRGDRFIVPEHWSAPLAGQAVIVAKVVDHPSGTVTIRLQDRLHTQITMQPLTEVDVITSDVVPAADGTFCDWCYAPATKVELNNPGDAAFVCDRCESEGVLA